MLFGRLYTAPASAMDYCDSSGEPTVLSDAPACTFCRGFVLSYALLFRLDPAWEPWVSRHLTDVFFASRQGACLVRSPSPRPVSRRRLSSPRRWTSRWSRFPPSPPHPSPGITTTNPSPPSLLRPNAGKHICCSGEAIECGWCSVSDGCTSLFGLSAHKHAHASPRPSATAQRR